jgi:uncharacterized membrane protein AbrB (regulator of aidB expression)
MEWGYYLYQAFGWWSVFVVPIIGIVGVGLALGFTNLNRIFDDEIVLWCTVFVVYVLTFIGCLYCDWYSWRIPLK